MRSRDKEQVEGRPSRRYREGDPDWLEHLDSRPVEMPTRLRVPGNQVARIRELIRREMSERAEMAGAESFEESDDFELEDEEWVSPYEEVFEPGVVDSGSQHGAAIKEQGNGRGTEVFGSGKEVGGLGAGPGNKGAGAADGSAGGSAGSGDGAGGSGKRDEGSKSES